MKSFEWLWKHTLKLGKILAVVFICLFILSAIIPKGYLSWIASKLAFAELRLPTPKETPVAVLKMTTIDQGSLVRSGFTTLVQSINLKPGQTIKEGDIVYGYARTDLFEKENGTMWVVVRRSDGAPIATGRAYTTYNTSGFGFVPFSARVPYLLVGGDCLLEFRRHDPKMVKLADILFTSMLVTCTASKVN